MFLIPPPIISHNMNFHTKMQRLIISITAWRRGKEGSVSSMLQTQRTIRLSS
uniref:Uncharacterized protein n=1 Tax=Anguilla anguilla TaxID=7936 RepID=A0A0E9S2P0_ANGAN